VETGLVVRSACPLYWRHAPADPHVGGHRRRGPAGLLLSHLLYRAGIDSIAVDNRSREEIENTVRAGILERDSVRLLVGSGASGRVLRDGSEHAGIELAFGGAGHRINFQELVGASVWLYPQTSVFVDLAAARERDGGDVRFGVSGTEVEGLASDSPTMRFTDVEGMRHEVRARYLVGADGSHSLCRHQMPEDSRRQYFREYPFAWFGILCDAPPSAPELIYNQSERGFALISQRTATVQRMYFQCDPATDSGACRMTVSGRSCRLVWAPTASG
jgi:2-polyprenyl-6-methoxyphenol hydroxylase-like FAD-dependent oxidoreductase